MANGLIFSLWVSAVIIFFSQTCGLKSKMSHLSVDHIIWRGFGESRSHLYIRLVAEMDESLARGCGERVPKHDK